MCESSKDAPTPAYDLVRAGRLNQSPGQISSAVHESFGDQLRFSEAVKNQNHGKRRLDFERANASQACTTKSSLHSKAGMRCELAQGGQDRGQKAFGNLLTRLFQIPAIRVLEITVKIVRASQRKTHGLRRALRSRTTLSAISRSSPSRSGECGPLTAFNNSASSSGLSSSRSSARGE